jgi:hypothetical protein
MAKQSAGVFIDSLMGAQNAREEDAHRDSFRRCVAGVLCSAENPSHSLKYAQLLGGGGGGQREIVARGDEAVPGGGRWIVELTGLTGG